MVAVVRIFAGQRAWLLQRASALVLLLFLVLGSTILVLGPPLTYERWHALATSAYGAVLIVVLFTALSVHGWVGARDIVLDYIHPPAWRLAVLALIAVVLFAVLIRVVLTIAAHITIAG